MMNPYYDQGYNSVMKVAGVGNFIRRGAKRIGDAVNVKGLKKIEKDLAGNAATLRAEQQVALNSPRMSALKKIKGNAQDDAAHWGSFGSKVKPGETPFAAADNMKRTDAANSKLERADKAIKSHTERVSEPFTDKITKADEAVSKTTKRVGDAEKLRGQAATGAKVVGGVGLTGAGIAGANHLYEKKQKQRSPLAKVRDTLGF